MVIHEAESDNNNVLDKDEVVWLLDSECTDHTVNNDTYFDKYIILKHPVSVEVGEDRTLQATNIGDIQATFLIYGSKS